MSSSEHPVALRLEQQVGGATKLLATVMALPLVDGIFPALVLAGALDSTVGIIQVGLLVFGGSATVAVILAEMDGSRREQITSVLLVGVGLVALASVEAWLAPTIKTALDLPRFKRFAALVIAAIAAKTASSRIGEILPRPAVIVGLGFLASLNPGSFHVDTVENYVLVERAAAAAGSGVAFALAVALAGPYLRGVVDIDRFRFGSSVALGLLALTVLFPMPGHAPLAVLVVTALLALDPGSDDADVAESDDAPEAAAVADADSTVDPSSEGTGARADAGDAGADGTSVERLAKRKAAKARTMATDGAGDESDSPGYGYPGEESTDEREPWL